MTDTEKSVFSAQERPHGPESHTNAIYPVGRGPNTHGMSPEQAHRHAMEEISRYGAKQQHAIAKATEVVANAAAESAASARDAAKAAREKMLLAYLACLAAMLTVILSALQYLRRE